MLLFHSMVCLSVCLSRSYIELQIAEDIDRISFAYDSPMSLSQIALKNLAYIGQLLRKLCPKVTHRC